MTKLTLTFDVPDKFDSKYLSVLNTEQIIDIIPLLDQGWETLLKTMYNLYGKEYITYIIKYCTSILITNN